MVDHLRKQQPRRSWTRRGLSDINRLAIRNGVERLLGLIDEGTDERVPAAAGECLRALQTQLVLVKRQILEADRRMLAWHRSNELSRRLEAIPGVGPLTSSCPPKKEQSS